MFVNTTLLIDKIKSAKSNYCLVIVLIISLSSIISCREVFDKKYISEGTIEYSVKYIGDESDNYLAQLMPNTMLCHFKDNKVALDLSGGMGFFRTTYIFDNKNKTFLQLVKMIQKKYSFKADSSNIRSINTEYPDLTVNLTNETKEIAGYNCKKAEVTFVDPNFEGFDVYYTEDINIISPNWCTQFYEIPGVLMEYRMKKYDMELQITAIQVSKDEIADETFDLPEDYKMISHKDMENLFLGFN